MASVVLLSTSRNHIGASKLKGCFTHVLTQTHTHKHWHHNSQCSDSVIGGRHVSLTRLLVNCICECFQALHVILRAREKKRVWEGDYSSAQSGWHMLGHVQWHDIATSPTSSTRAWQFISIKFSLLSVFKFKVLICYLFPIWPRLIYTI